MCSVHIVWRSSAGLRQCRVVRHCIVGCRDKCNEVCAAFKNYYPVECYSLHKMFEGPLHGKWS